MDATRWILLAAAARGLGRDRRGAPAKPERRSDGGGCRLGVSGAPDGSRAFVEGNRHIREIQYDSDLSGA
ncbi:hypothetical protein OVY01_04815 [Robbsia sp. Bb-Pol-6]|uniref:Uncharacterized protein n=1 Tax=Robbsia betulipollinis TaxID=2981849 RepID=A0ABT3ZJ57_9BURK|nr:hypothetical protein [Robbsia betulipollinis]MCY0386569.1 hypothetical protein [Robbsia betulipollinis]